MAWDFETEPGYAKDLEWMQAFVHAEVDPLEYVLDGAGAEES